MKIKQFEIWIADLNPQIDTETGNVRPVIVIQTNLLNNDHPSTVICPITTNVNPEVEVLRVHLTKSRFGLNGDSDIMIDQIRSIDNKRLLRKTGRVNEETAELIKESLKIVLDLD